MRKPLVIEGRGSIRVDREEAIAYNWKKIQRLVRGTKMHPRQMSDIEVVTELRRLVRNAEGAKDELIQFIQVLGNQAQSPTLETAIEEAYAIENDRLLAIGASTVEQAEQKGES